MIDFSIKTEQEQENYFRRSLEITLKVNSGCDVIDYRISVANIKIQIIFSSELIASYIMPALEHIRISSDEDCSAVFYVWDSNSTGHHMLPPPCSRDRFTNRGDLWGFNSRQYRTAFHWSDYSVNLFDSVTLTGIYWMQDITKIPYWSAASPLRSLFHWLMAEHGYQLIHAAAVGNDEGAVVITGKGGIGKSTTALTCLENSMKYIGDDYIIIGSHPAPTAYSLYSTAKLNADQLEKFPALTTCLVNGQNLVKEKGAYYLYPEYRDQICLELPVRGVLTPKVSGLPRTDLRPISKTLLLGAATITSMSQLPYSNQQTHEFIEKFIKELPCGQLCLGHELVGVAKFIQDLLRPGLHSLDSPIMQNDNAPELDSFPLISVIIPVFNGAKFLPTAINSVMSQGYPALEVIVVDDGSTDNIEEVVSRLPVDVRFYQQENRGPAAARNFGIKDAGGEFIAFLDVDDQWPNDTLNLLSELLRNNPSAMLVKGHAQLQYLDPASGEYTHTGNPEDSFANYIGSALYRTTAFQKIGLFDADLKFGEDTDWYMRASEQQLNILRADLVTLLVRRHGENMTARASPVEIRALRMFKKAIDRRREQMSIDSERSAISETHP